MALADFRLIVTDKLRDTAAVVTGPEKDRAILEAVRDYASKVKPRRRVQTITGDGASFTFALASDFQEGLSSIEQIEHPVDEQDPQYLDSDDYRLYRDPATAVLKLRVTAMVLAVAEKAYVHYTADHTVNDAGVDTVPPPAREPIASKAAAILLRQLAARASNTADSTLGADSIDRLSQVDKYLSVAAVLDKEYARAFGITAGVAPASAIKDLDVDMQDGAGERFFHSRRFR